MILVVDDEPFVRELTRRILERHGFTAEICSDGAAALRFLQSHGAEVELILLDIFMPGLSGEALLKALAAVRPNVPVVASTGFDAGDIMRRYAANGVVACLHKPFDVQEVVEQVRTFARKPSRQTRHAAA